MTAIPVTLIHLSLLQYEAMVQLEAKATAYTLEAGIIFHSIFIGITLGSTSGAATVRSLMIALMFHQGNEVGASGFRPAWSKLMLTKPAPLLRPTQLIAPGFRTRLPASAALPCAGVDRHHKR